MRAYWIAAAALAGLLVGLYVGRLGRDVPQSGDEDGARSGIVASPPLTLPGDAPGTPSTKPAAPSGSPSPDAGTPGNSAPEAPAGLAPDNPPPSADQLALDLDGPPAGHVENMKTLHAQFLREERDDSWAYLRESEIENSMVMEVSAGKFDKDRIECRATLCELELSAKGEQVEQLRKWFDVMNAPRAPDLANAHLVARMGSFSGEKDRATVSMVLVKPESVLPR